MVVFAMTSGLVVKDGTLIYFYEKGGVAWQPRQMGRTSALW
jgi:hypothetical protein